MNEDKNQSPYDPSVARWPQWQEEAMLKLQEGAAKAFLEARGYTVTKTETASQARARVEAKKWGFR